MQLALSVKTNYLPALLLDAAEAGLWFEVVSAMEYEMVRSLGVEPELIVVNGPVKSSAFIQHALFEGALVQLDVPEIEAVARAGESERPLRVGLRINVPPRAGGFSRFGFDADTPDFHQHVQRLRKICGVQLEGLHAHVCTPDRSARDYAALARRLLAVSDAVFQNETPRLINIGGGFLRARRQRSSASSFPFHGPVSMNMAPR